MELFAPLKDIIRQYMMPAQIERVEKAFLLAKDGHEGQIRSSGEPYITHPVAVACILADMRFDTETIKAALLHDVIEDTPYTSEQLRKEFGETVTAIVEGVTKLDKLKFNNREEHQAENFRKMMMAMTEDIRVILVKLADRTHNMRTLGALRPEKARRIATETLEVYAPLAHRLGIHEIKNELENLGFKAMYPMRYRALASAVKQARGNRKEVMDSVEQGIKSRLQEYGLSAKVSGREKHLYSLYQKMRNKELMFNEVMDIYAFRLIMHSTDDCYRALGAMHSLYKPREGRFKDYIAVPRTNGYQSLHTSLVGPHGIPVEVQIRTNEMDMLADKGVAAHWMYKSDEEKTDFSEIATRKWMQSIVELQQSASSSHEFVDNVKADLVPDEIYLFSPKGRIIELPRGACAVDFAYAVHSDVGNRCVGARVNNKNYSLSEPLETGQSVEIITSPRAKPNANWLNFCVSARARGRIRSYLRTQETHDALEMGNRLLRHALGNVSLDDIEPERIAQVLAETKYQDMAELLTEIGLGNEMSAVFARRLLGDQEHASQTNGNVAIKGTEGLTVNYAKCCGPIPGDEIVALLNPGKGMMIHQAGCKNIRKLSKDEPQRLLAMAWDEELQGEFRTSLRIEIFNYQGILAKLTNWVASTGSNIINLQTTEKESNVYYIDIELTTTDRIHFSRIIKRIRKMDEVKKVSRHSQAKSQ